MIKKLRRSFIITAMISVIAVLTVLLAAINTANFLSSDSEADELLTLLADNGGAFPARMLDTYEVDDRSNTNRDQRDRPPQMPFDMSDKGREGFGGRFSMETAFETRYFTVSVDGSGAVSYVDTSFIAAITEDEAADIAGNVMKSGAEKGFYRSYRYLVSGEGDSRLIVFLDRTRELGTFREFLGSSVLISLAGFLAVLLLITILSARIVKPISDSYEKQKRFITDAGHEIKTPLTIIDADAEVLEMEIGDGNEWLDEIKKQTRRLSGLTADLIYLAKMEEDSYLPKVRMIEFPLSDITAECARSFTGMARSQGKRLEVDIAPMLSMRGDEKAITQLINILLDNAMKYSPENGGISLRLTSSGRNITLSVSNDASPMSKEDISHIFDRFYRAEKSRSTKTGGSGIGLSVAHAIVSAHKGRITASQDEDGVFTVTASMPQ
ncbi:MAG: HAMP domain-containing histidine kinase [Ruminiclostridium sp.]|nr:HAMP domain-containing histidine kinase [Ruminiclostridium sp.]